MAFSKTVLFSVGALVSFSVDSTFSQCVDFDNSGFEQDGIRSGTYLKECPSSWTCNVPLKTGIISQGNGAWGGRRSDSGKYFGVLQTAGTYMQQQITLEKGETYSLSLLTADRPGYGNDESFTLTVGGIPVFKDLHPFPQFVRHKGTFTANSDKMILKILNTSPDGDKSVFLDDIQICKVAPDCTEMTNGDFEQDYDTAFRGDTYAVDIDPTGWTKKGRTHVIRQGAPPWGSLQSGSGAFYLALQNKDTSIAQTVNNLIAGRQYYVKYLLAERPGYKNTEELTLTITTQGQTTVTDVVNPYSSFAEHTLTFTAGSKPSVIKFTNTMDDEEDKSIFLDNIRICEVITTVTTTTVTATSTTTTQTATSNTILARSFDEVKDQLISLERQQQALAKAQEKFGKMQAELSTQQAAFDSTQKSLGSAVASISDALQAAVNTIPPKNSKSQCIGDECKPQLAANSKDVTLIGERIQLQSSCGVIDPCTLMDALNALRRDV